MTGRVARFIAAAVLVFALLVAVIYALVAMFSPSVVMGGAAIYLALVTITFNMAKTVGPKDWTGEPAALREAPTREMLLVFFWPVGLPVLLRRWLRHRAA